MNVRYKNSNIPTITKTLNPKGIPDSVKGLVIQSTSGTYTVDNLYDDIQPASLSELKTKLNGRRFAHFVVNHNETVKYVPYTNDVFFPDDVFTTKAINLFQTKDDNPSQHLIVLELDLTGSSSTNDYELNLIKTCGDFLIENELTTDSLWRIGDIVQNNTQTPQRYCSSANWQALLQAILVYMNRVKTNDGDSEVSIPLSGIAYTSTSTFVQDTRTVYDDFINSVSIETIKQNDFENKEVNGVIKVIDKFTSKIVNMQINNSNLYEPGYPDYTVPPKSSTQLYNEKITNIKDKTNAVKSILGSIVNLDDPYPVDRKIVEMEAHIPIVHFEGSELQCPTSGCNIPEALFQMSVRTEQRLVQLENITSTLMRYLFRLSSRLNVNCVYFGGQSSSDKYSCIRCLNDDMTTDGAIVQLDQCLNCSRYEPEIGQVYDILNSNGDIDLGPILDNNQLSRMSMEEYIKFSRLEELHKPQEKNKIDPTGIKPKNFDELGYGKDSKKMNWTEVAFSPQVDVTGFKYSPSLLKDSGYSLGTTSTTETANDSGITNARAIILKKAQDIINLCLQSKAQYNWASVGNILGNGKIGYDCSGYALTCYKTATFTLLRDSRSQYDECVKEGMVFTNESDAIPGDLVFFSKSDAAHIHHVAIYCGKGMMYESSCHHTKDPEHKDIKQSKIAGRDFFSFGRPKCLVDNDKKESVLMNCDNKIFDLNYQGMNISTQKDPKLLELLKSKSAVVSNADINLAVNNYRKYIVESIGKDAFKATCKAHGVDPAFLLALGATESHLTPTASNSYGYKGMFQMQEAKIGVTEEIIKQQVGLGINHINQKKAALSDTNSPCLIACAYNGGQGMIVGTKDGKAKNIFGNKANLKTSGMSAGIKWQDIILKIANNAKSNYGTDAKYFEVGCYFVKLCKYYSIFYELLK